MTKSDALTKANEMFGAGRAVLKRRNGICYIYRPTVRRMKMIGSGPTWDEALRDAIPFARPLYFLERMEAK